MIRGIAMLSVGDTISYAPYDHKTGKHSAERITVSRSDIVLVDGLHSFHPRAIHYMKLKLFLYAAPPDAKELRFMVDLFERGYTAHEAFQHSQWEYDQFVDHVLHYIKFADHVVQIDNYWKYRL